jgi:hypothetical protein
MDPQLLHFWEQFKAIAGVVIAAGIAWTPIATFIATKVPRPTTPRWKRFAYDFFVDVPAWAAAAERSGVFGGKFNLPLVPSRNPMDNPPKNGEPPPAPPPSL